MYNELLKDSKEPIANFEKLNIKFERQKCKYIMDLVHEYEIDWFIKQMILIMCVTSQRAGRGTLRSLR